MDILIIIFLAVTSIIFMPLVPSLFVVVFTIVWYMLGDRLLLNFLVAIPTRFIFTRTSKTVNMPMTTALIEIVKAPLSAFFGSLVILSFVENKNAALLFILGLLLFSANFHFFTGLFRNHPYKIIMYFSVFVGSLIGLYLAYNV